MNCPNCGIDKEVVAKDLAHLEEQIKVILSTLTSKQATAILELMTKNEFKKQGLIK